MRGRLRGEVSVAFVFVRCCSIVLFHFFKSKSKEVDGRHVSKVVVGIALFLSFACVFDLACEYRLLFR